jgi:hypothetical protein
MRRGWFMRLAAASAFAFAGHLALADGAEPIRAEAGTDAEAYCSRIQAAFTRQDFAALEATAAQARSLKIHLRGGKTELQVFYESFVRVACNQTYIYLNEDTGQTRTAIAERWLGDHPDSVTAKIASAMIWNQFAWAGRGRGYANEVSQEQWSTFGDRLKRAAQFMRAVDPNSDAQAYLVLLALARDLNVPRAQIDTIFVRARERFPSYLGYYADYATILLPKWFGQPGEIADYLKSLLSAPGGDLGAMAYARAAERLSFDMGSPDIYRDTSLVWDDLRRGFTLRERSDGLDKHAWISFCYYAVMAGDRDTAREAYRHIPQIDEWPVGGTHRFFLTVLPWIMDRG